MIYRFFLYVILVITLLVLLYSYLYPKAKIDTLSLGNTLSSYFYVLNSSESKRLSKFDVPENTNPELRKFYEQLDWKYGDNLIDYNSSWKSAWQQIDRDGSGKNNYLLFWQTVRPVASQVYKDNLKLPAVKYPVVHFRCSDIPFSKHGMYHLVKSSSVKWMAEKIKSRGYDRVTLLSCSAHNSKDKNDSCAKYISFYSSIFADAGIAVETQCNSVLEDFAMMVSSPLLVSLNPSSYSFMAGISKDPHDYISCNMGHEIKGKYVKQTVADWYLDTTEPLLHRDVKDYHNTDDVINKLRLGKTALFQIVGSK